MFEASKSFLATAVSTQLRRTQLPAIALPSFHQIRLFENSKK